MTYSIQAKQAPDRQQNKKNSKIFSHRKVSLIQRHSVLGTATVSHHHPIAIQPFTKRKSNASK
jgi:type II secretory pathway component PulC